jgi:hypothetical protein
MHTSHGHLSHTSPNQGIALFLVSSQLFNGIAMTDFSQSYFLPIACKAFMQLLPRLFVRQPLHLSLHTSRIHKLFLNRRKSGDH